MAAEGAWSRYIMRNGRIEAHVYVLNFEYCNVSSSNIHILAIAPQQAPIVQVELRGKGMLVGWFILRRMLPVRGMREKVPMYL